MYLFGGGRRGASPHGRCCSHGGGTTPLPSSTGAQQQCWALGLGFSGHGQPHGLAPVCHPFLQDHDCVTPSFWADAVRVLLAPQLGTTQAGISKPQISSPLGKTRSRQRRAQSQFTKENPKLCGPSLTVAQGGRFSLEGTQQGDSRRGQ